MASTIGFLCDALYRNFNNHHYLSLGILRKLANSIAFIGAGGCLLLISFLGRDKLGNIILLVLALGFDGMIMAGFMVTHVDMSPNFAGTLMGITNCVANFAGIFAPMVVGQILTLVIGDDGNDHNNGKELLKTIKEQKALLAWHYVFYLSAVVFLVSALIFIIFGSNEVQDWNSLSPNSDGNENEDKNDERKKENLNE